MNSTTPNIQMSRKWKNELVLNIIDQVATNDPDALYAEYPVSALTYNDGYRKITYGDFANAINGVASWIQKTLGPPRKENEVLAYIGPNDLRYASVILGALKAGYLIFITSPRNSVIAQINLFNKLGCETILSPSPQPPPVSAILEAEPAIRSFEIPSVEFFLETKFPKLPFEKTFTEARREPFCIVHTSGSTGIPKTLTYTNDTAAKFMHLAALEAPEGFQTQDEMFRKRRLFVTFPPFHAAYLALTLFNAVPFGTIIISPISGSLPSAEGLVEALKKTPVDVAFLVPSIVQELSLHANLLDYCAKNLDLILYCGGDLPQPIGDKVNSKIRLINQMGATEIGIASQLHPIDGSSREDWKYIYIHPKSGVEYKPALNDASELYVIRKPEFIDQQPTFTLFPHLEKEYAHGDLFIQHPLEGKKHLWKWVARADDVIVFLNGEKTNPISMEQHIVARNPEIRAALVMGAQRFQASLLIDLKEGDKELSIAERASVIEKIWPSIEEANQECPAHARIAKTHIFFSHPHKRILIAGKGTVQRAGTLRLYDEELDSLYANAEKMGGGLDGEEAGSVNHDDLPAVSAFIKDSILSITNWNGFADMDDFFALGLDSLQGLMLVRKLRHGLAIPEIAISTIYANPSITQLTDSIIELISKNHITESSNLEERYQTRSKIIQQFQEKIDLIPVAPEKKKFSPKVNESVILTGSTGALGSYILDTLLSNERVHHIYCLNRSSSSRDLQESRNKTKSLPTIFSPSKVSFLTADFSKPLLGLGHEKYEDLAKNATLILHNAWPVNFNISLPSFRPSIEGLVNLVTLSAEESIPLFFISSISSVMAYQTSSHRTPEKIIPMAISEKQLVPGPNGYAESKYVSELILSYAAKRFPHMNAGFSLARVGQVAGPIKQPGIWNKSEWFPSLVLSSLHIGAIPDTLGSALGRIDWVPIDLLAEVLVELCLSPNSNQEGEVKVFHPMNPHPKTWDDIKPVIIAYLTKASGKKIEVVSLENWIFKVRKDIESKAGGENTMKEGDLMAALEANPAAKLLDFYEDVLLGGKDDVVANIFETRETETVCKKLTGLEGVKDQWIEKWVEEWLRKTGSDGK